MTKSVWATGSCSTAPAKTCVEGGGHGDCHGRLFCGSCRQLLGAFSFFCGEGLSAQLVKRVINMSVLV